MNFEPASLYGVIGYPLGHSLSPLLHTTGFRAIGSPDVLVAWPIEPGRVGEFVSAVRLLRVRGVCVTIPHKQAIMSFLDRVTERARDVGAVNTLFWQGAELWGDNTDVPGFIAPLTTEASMEALGPSPRILMLGAGGASRAVVVGLRSLGYRDIVVANRSPAAAEALAADFGLAVEPWERRGDIPADLVINTTPLGMKSTYEAETPFPADAFSGRHGIAYDIVYTPLRTRFLRDAENAGWRTVSGLDMFIGQADHQFRIWKGVPLPSAAAEAVAAVLADR
jgi:shikimate dehydrogenase